MRACVRACMRACVRACVRVCLCVCLKGGEGKGRGYVCLISGKCYFIYIYGKSSGLFCTVLFFYLNSI